MIHLKNVHQAKFSFVCVLSATGKYSFTLCLGRSLRVCFLLRQEMKNVLVIAAAAVEPANEIYWQHPVDRTDCRIPAS